MIESRKGVYRLRRSAARRRNAIVRAEIDRLFMDYQKARELVFGGFQESLPERYPEPSRTRSLRERLGRFFSVHKD